MNARFAQKPWRVLLTLLSVVVLLVGCGGSSNTGTGGAAAGDSGANAAATTGAGQSGGAEAAATTGAAQSGGAEAAATVPAANTGSGEQVTLRWYMRWDKARLENVAQPVIEAFEKENPNINVEIENVGSGSEYWTKLQTMIAGGTAPDIVYPATHNGYALASKGALLSLDSFLERDKIDVSKFDPAIIDLYRYDGKLYGLPIDKAALVVFYNKKLFDEAKVAYPKDDWTWDDFLEAAKATTKDTNGDGRNDIFGVDTFTQYWPVMVWTRTGHNIFDDPKKPTKFLLDDPEATAGLQWLADLSNKEHVMPSAAERADISDMFLAGKSAMQIVGHWRVPQYMANVKDFEWDIAALPRGKIAANRSDGSSFAITANSKHPEEAWQFVRFLAGPGSTGVERLLELQQMTPALKEFQQSDVFLKPEALPNVNKAAFLAGSDNLFTMYDPIHPAYDEISAIETQELNELWNGNATAQQAVERMKPQIEAALKKIQ